MIKQIRFTGMSSRPSDRTVGEGELAYCQDLVNDGGSLVPLERLADADLVIGAAGDSQSPATVMHIHHTTDGGTNAVYLRSTTSEGETTYGLHYWNDGQQTIKDGLPEVYRVTSVGNYLCVLTAESVQYALWKGSGYDWLGAMPPYLGIQFGLDPVAIMSEESVGNCTLNRVSESDTDESGLHTVEVSDNNRELDPLVAAAMDDIRQKACRPTEVNVRPKFTESFWVRYALRMADGGVQYASAPVLMPAGDGITPAIIGKDNLQSSSSGYEYWMAFYGIAYASVLKYKYAGGELPDEWKNLIKSVDIYVTNPVSAEDRTLHVPTVYRRRQRRATSLTAADLYAIESLYGQTTAGRTGAFPWSHIFSDNESFRNGALNRLSQMGGDVEMTDGVFVMSFPSRESDKIEADLQQVGPFYKVASIPIDSLSTSWAEVPIYHDTLSLLLTQETLSEGYRERDTTIARQALAYNGRLNLGDVTTKLYAGQPLPDQLASWMPSSSGEEVSLGVIWHVREGSTGVRRVPGGEHTVRMQYSSLVSSWSLLLTSLYYPNSNAYRAELYATVTRAGRSTEHLYASLDLTECGLSDGAVWYNDDFSSSIGFEDWPEDFDPEDVNPLQVFRSRVMQSEVLNPLEYRAANVQDVGLREVRGFATTARSVHAQQNGRDPLYVFTGDAVWVMSLNDDGTYLSVRPAAYHTLQKDSDPVQTDDSVAYISDDGGVYVLAGGESVNISEVIDSLEVFDPTFMKVGQEYLTNFAPLTLDGRFRSYLPGARLAFDYRYGRLIVFRTDKAYGYVFSKSSRTWSLLGQGLSQAVQDYPEQYFLLQSQTGSTYYWLKHLVDVNHASGYDSRLLVSRPVIPYEGGISTMVDVRLDGVSTPGRSRQMILYGSQDLERWQLVGSSTTGVIRSIHCPPFRAYRVAVSLTMAPGDSLSGVTMTYTPRVPSHIR